MKNLGFILLAVITGLASCGKDNSPKVEIFYEYDDTDAKTVHFSAKTEGAESFEWNFGDEATSTEEEASHTYATTGKYAVSLTVTGEGGETTAKRDVTIATLKELIAGMEDDPDGKTWKLSTVVTASNIDGVGYINDNLDPNYMPGTDNMLSFIDMESEYDNLFTFKYDGSYKVDPVNGTVLAGWVYGYREMSDDLVEDTGYGFVRVNYSNPNTTWTLTKHTDLTIVGFDNTTNTVRDFVFEGSNYLEFGTGGFIVLKDYINTVIVRNATPNRLVLTAFSHNTDDYVEEILGIPTMIVTFSFDAVED